jgi:hypothetical protein
VTPSHTFPTGTHRVTAKAYDACGNEGVCEFLVTVNPVNDVTIEVELDGVVIPDSRCIHFVTDTCVEVADVELTFVDHDGDDSNQNGIVDSTEGTTNDPATPVRASDTVEVPCGAWTQLCVKDEQHTLWSTVTLTDQGTYYEADSLVSLTSGDTDNDSDIDINDVTWLLYQFGTGANDGDCPWDGTRDADFSLNGAVGAEDYTFLSTNWLQYSDCPCAAMLTRPLRTVSKQQVQLAADTLPAEVRQRVDLNQDGVIDYVDVALFEIEHNLPATLSTKMWQATEHAELMRN